MNLLNGEFRCSNSPVATQAGHPHFYCVVLKSVAFYLAVALSLGACADMVVEDVNYEQFTTTSLVMKGTVKNQGQQPAGESETSLERKYDWADPFVETARIATAAIDAGDQVEVPLWTFSQAEFPQPGSCMHVRVCADVDDDVDEQAFGLSREGNNCLTKSIMNRQFCPSCDLCCNQTLPLVFDWRNWKGVDWITAVRDQAMCGSCWAFSAIAAVEAKNNVEGEPSQINSVDLSEQELVSCPTGGGTCLGGWPSSAFGYIRNERVVEEAGLPYTSTDCIYWDDTINAYQCKAACSSTTIPGCANPLLTAAQCSVLGSGPPSTWRLESLQWIGGADIDDVKRALLCHGPLSVTSSEWRHAVLLVGWNPVGWIIKNSWGTNWGTNGYGIIPFTGDPHSDIKNNAWYVQEIREWE